MGYCELTHREVDEHFLSAGQQNADLIQCTTEQVLTSYQNKVEQYQE